MNVQKRLAASILKCSPYRISFDETKLDEIKEAITRRDVRGLIKKHIIIKSQLWGGSKVRARKIQSQKSKGRRTGAGSRKGKSTARLNPKQAWMARIRVQREFLRVLREKGIITTQAFHDLYLKAKGGFFRSKRHLSIYLKEKVLK